MTVPPTPSPPPSAQWILLAAAVGAAGAIIAQILAQLLMRGRERRRFQIEAFERFRSEFIEDKELREISKKHDSSEEDSLNDEEIERYLDFFEDVGMYASRKLIDVIMVDETMGDYILEAYEDTRIMRYVGAVRREQHDPSYWEHFENLAKDLQKRKKRRTG